MVRHSRSDNRAAASFWPSGYASECHAVQKEYSRSPNANAPRFQAIASIPGMTATALSAALNTPHRVMPNIMLATDEQADIVAYILSLK